MMVGIGKRKKKEGDLNEDGGNTELTIFKNMYQKGEGKDEGEGGEDRMLRETEKKRVKKKRNEKEMK